MNYTLKEVGNKPGSSLIGGARVCPLLNWTMVLSSIEQNCPNFVGFWDTELGLTSRKVRSQSLVLHSMYSSVERPPNWRRQYGGKNPSLVHISPPISETLPVGDVGIESI